MDRSAFPDLVPRRRRATAHLTVARRYRTFAGHEWSNPMHELVRHVVNQGTCPRGRSSLRIGQLGHASPSTEFTARSRPSGAERAERA